MSTSRRKTLVRAIEGTAVVLVVLDFALYFALLLPFGNLMKVEQERRANTYRALQEHAERVARLESYVEALPVADEQIKLFLHDHVPQRRRGYSHAARLVREFARDAGIQLTGVAYSLDSDRKAPLERLGMTVNVEGPFERLLNFAHALETASDFIVVRDFAFQPGNQGALSLRVSADLYLAP